MLACVKALSCTTVPANYTMKNTILIPSTILLFSILFIACKTIKNADPIGFENEYFGIKGTNCIEIPNPDAIDSKVGQLDCGCVTLNYDYGRYSNPGPLSRIEEFRRAFDTYHHTKFFENRMIDPKVHLIFLDSVDVVDVNPKLDSDELMFDCSTCNAKAVLTFKKDTYLFPFTMNEVQLNRDEQGIEFVERSPLQYKYYTDTDGAPGLYVTPIQNRFKKKNCLSMTVDTSECRKEEVEKILQAVYLNIDPKK